MFLRSYILFSWNIIFLIWWCFLTRTIRYFFFSKILILGCLCYPVSFSLVFQIKFFLKFIIFPCCWLFIHRLGSPLMGHWSFISSNFRLSRSAFCSSHVKLQLTLRNRVCLGCGSSDLFYDSGLEWDNPL